MNKIATHVTQCTGNQKCTTYQMQFTENSSTNGKDATRSNMETQNANKWQMQRKANAWHSELYKIRAWPLDYLRQILRPFTTRHLHNKTSKIKRQRMKQIKLALENIWKWKRWNKLSLHHRQWLLKHSLLGVTDAPSWAVAAPAAWIAPTQIQRQGAQRAINRWLLFLSRHVPSLN